MIKSSTYPNHSESVPATNDYDPPFKAGPLISWVILKGQGILPLNIDSISQLSSVQQKIKTPVLNRIGNVVTYLTNLAANVAGGHSDWFLIAAKLTFLFVLLFPISPAVAAVPIVFGAAGLIMKIIEVFFNLITNAVIYFTSSKYILTSVDQQIINDFNAVVDFDQKENTSKLFEWRRSALVCIDHARSCNKESYSDSLPRMIKFNQISHKILQLHQSISTYTLGGQKFTRIIITNY